MTPEQPEKTSATNEELLRKVIEAQVKGGFTDYQWHITEGDSIYISPHGHSVYATQETPFSFLAKSMKVDILRILLDTEGCKAAYGDEVIVGTKRWLTSVDFTGLVDIPKEEQTHTWRQKDLASHMILCAWHSGDGNNVRAALETAVSFLPTE